MLARCWLVRLRLDETLNTSRDVIWSQRGYSAFPSCSSILRLKLVWVVVPEKPAQLLSKPSTPTPSIMTFSILTFSILTFSVLTFSIMTCRIMTFSIMTLSINVTQHGDTLPNYTQHYDTQDCNTYDSDRESTKFIMWLKSPLSYLIFVSKAGFWHGIALITAIIIMARSRKGLFTTQSINDT